MNRISAPHALLIATLSLLATFTAEAADPKVFLIACPLKTGDPLEKVKGFYQLTEDPTPSEYRYPGGAYYQYNLSTYGVWIFLDEAKRVRSLRFDSPFLGKIDGISIGDSKSEVSRTKGQPTRVFDGLEDKDASTLMQKQRLEIISSIPDPAPREAVQVAFAKIIKITEAPLPFNEAWAYGSGTELMRYDFGSLSGKVQMMISHRGTVQP